ncbi:MAG: Methyltransferase, FkbM family [Candidatus Acidoferrum typicum]|nr:Methyltransferase, FkbM family [Candidatus Acidoferrum typicum]
MNFPNLVPFDTFVGRLLRLPLRLIPNGTCIPVLSGPNRGHRFIKGAGTNGYWFGSAEREHQTLAMKHIGPGQIVYDIGANVGLHTLLFSRLVGEQGRVFAFEPAPDTAALLAEHVRLNRKTNVTIIQKAIAGHAGEMRFSASVDSRIRRFDVGGETTVLSVTLDQMVRDLPPPACIKMDIEGAEVEALQGAAECFQRYRPKLFLATHDTDGPCCALLRSWGYNIEFFAGPDLLALPN